MLLPEIGPPWNAKAKIRKSSCRRETRCLVWARKEAVWVSPLARSSLSIARDKFGKFGVAVGRG